MISRDELRQLKAKLLTYCSENDLFDDYNVEGIFDIVAERFMTSDFETLEKEINEVIPKRKFQKFKNMTYNNRIIKDLEDIKEYNELLKRYEFISFISYYLIDNLGDEWITRRVNAMFPEYLLNDLHQVLVRSVEHYKKDKKRKEILSKTGKVIGTIAFSPFLLLGAIAKYSFAESDAEKKQRRYYCKYCGKSEKDPRSLTSGFCLQRTRMNEYLTSKHTPLVHQIYEGSEKSEYTCKHCGKSFKSFSDLVNNTCIPRYQMNRDITNTLYRVAMSHCEPIL